MPELPEVETVARQLAPLVEGRAWAGLRILDPRLDPGRRPRLGSCAVLAVRRVGKQVVFSLGPAAGAPRAHLAVHLRMTGRLTFVPSGARAPRRHLRAVLRLAGGTVRFHDPRRFGTLRFVDEPATLLGGAVDPFDPRLTPARLGRLLGGSRQEIKPWLLRQDRLVGVGNIYASEILFEAGISPFARAGELDPAAVRRLRRSLRAVLRRAIRCCGTTFSDFQDAWGMTGSYQDRLRVYGREGRACPRCGAPIGRAVQQQRSTFFCLAACGPPGPDNKRRAGDAPGFRKP